MDGRPAFLDIDRDQLIDAEEDSGIFDGIEGVGDEDLDGIPNFSAPSNSLYSSEQRASSHGPI